MTQIRVGHLYKKLIVGIVCIVLVRGGGIPVVSLYVDYLLQGL